jgi:hypothetical protein
VYFFTAIYSIIDIVIVHCGRPVVIVVYNTLDVRIVYCIREGTKVYRELTVRIATAAPELVRMVFRRTLKVMSKRRHG